MIVIIILTSGAKCVKITTDFYVFLNKCHISFTTIIPVLSCGKHYKKKQQTKKTKEREEYIIN